MILEEVEANLLAHYSSYRLAGKSQEPFGG